MGNAKRCKVSNILAFLLGLEALASASTVTGKVQTLRVAVGIVVGIV